MSMSLMIHEFHRYFDGDGVPWVVCVAEDWVASKDAGRPVFDRRYAVCEEYEFSDFPNMFVSPLSACPMDSSHFETSGGEGDLDERFREVVAGKSAAELNVAAAGGYLQSASWLLESDGLTDCAERACVMAEWLYSRSGLDDGALADASASVARVRGEVAAKRAERDSVA